MSEDDRRYNEANEDQKANLSERSFGTPMSEAEIAALFGEKPPEHKPAPKAPTTDAEYKAYEEALVWATDIYRIAARVKNSVRGTGGGLTPQAEMLCNTYVHVLKSFYDFSETIKDENIKKALIDLIRKNEDMPANVVAAAFAGMRK